MAPRSLVPPRGRLNVGALAALALWGLWASTAPAVTPSLLKDIEPGAQGSLPTFMAPVGDQLFFVARAPISGDLSLWKTDGAPAHTEQVKALALKPTDFAAFQGYLYFPASDTAHGQELWRSDGTTTHTEVLDLVHGTRGSLPSGLTVANSLLFFAANDRVHGKELWASDGTPGGPHMVKDIGTETVYSSSPIYLTNFNDTLFFSALTASEGRELWKSDGTGDGTQLVKDIDPQGSSNPVLTRLSDFHQTLVFTASDPDHGAELRKTDGTESGTLLLKDIQLGPVGSSPSIAEATTSDTVFLAADDGVHGIELWKTDGTPEGTALVKDINSTATSSLNPPLEGAVIGREFLFAADDGIHGRELWKSDGTPEGTTLVMDISTTSSSNPGDFQAAGFAVFFTAFDDIHGKRWWVTDGTEYGTRMVNDIALDPAMVIPGGGPIGAYFNGDFFCLGDNGATGPEPWMVLKGAPPVLDSVTDQGDSVELLQWTNPAGAAEAFYALAYDLYAEQWAAIGADGSPWLPFDATVNQGLADLAHTGGYFIWISSVFWDGWWPTLGPWAGIEYSGTPHTALDMWAETTGTLAARLHWRPDFYGTWHWQIIAFKEGEGFVDVDGPSGNQLWHFIDYGGLGYDPSKADFFGAWADFILPSAGRWWFFLRPLAWLPPYPAGEYTLAYVDVP